MMTFFRRIELSSRPMLLLCGSEGAGKTTLLAKSGLACEYLHPDGSSISRRDTPVWFFSENAVYVSGISGIGQPMPQDKKQAESGNNKQKKKDRKKKQAAPVNRQEAFYAELKKNRLWRRRAIDGVLMVVDIADLLKSDLARINKIASDLRAQADNIVFMTGYRVPVYLIFNKSDKIEGFRELFSDKSAVERMPYVGSLVHGDGVLKQPPKDLFSSHYKKVYDVLADLCVLGVVDANRREMLEKQPGALDDHIELATTNRSEPAKAGIVGERAAISRLTQEFLLAEDKLSSFVETFFVDRGRDRPLFGGFFFTPSMMDRASEPDKPVVFSNRTLFGEIIPRAKHKIREAGEGTLFHHVKKVCHTLFVVLCWVIAGILIPGSGLRDAQHLRDVQTELSALLETEPTLENQYAALFTLFQSYEFLQNKYVPPGRVIFGTGKARAAIEDVYLTAAKEILATPAAERLETSIQQRADRGGEPTADEHQRLYRSLEAYLILTGGYPPDGGTFDIAAVTEVVERSLKLSLGQHYNSIDSKILQDNIRAVMVFAANGLLSVPSNERVISAARDKLARTPRAETIYSATMERLRTPPRAVPMNRIAGKSELVHHDREVSTLYTREGWEQTVYAGLIDASKDPFKNNWVTGPARVPVDEEKLLSELVTLYARDMRNRWLDFIRATALNLPSDLTTFAGDLEKLSLQKSELGRTLAIACSLATQPPRDVTMPEAPSKKTSLADITGQISGMANKVRGDLLNFTRNVPDPFTEAKLTFGPIDEFLTGDGFLKYRNDLSELSKVIKQSAERGGFAAAFAVRGGENPISKSRKNLAGAYVNMPDEASQIVKRLLEAPLDHATTILARAVSAELEEAWSGEVTKYFNEKLAARYPFDKNAPDAPYSDFEEFFKPQSGILWKHIDKSLSGLIERTPKGWIPVAAPPISVFVSDEALHSINRADKIATAFFRSDGASQQDISFSPFTSSFGSVRFSIGEKPFDFTGGLPVAVTRSSGASETVVLRISSAAGKDAGELRFAGEWSLARLFDAAKVEPLARSRYNARWSINVQNIYTAHVTSVVQSNATALFDESITRGFNVPAKVLRGQR